MELINALSTLVIAIATIVATRATWTMAGIERNRDIASNGIFAWVTPDQFYIHNGTTGAGSRWLTLNAKSVSSLPVYDVNIEVLLDREVKSFSSLTKGEVVYSQRFPVLFEKEKEMTPHSIKIEEIRNSELKNFLSTPNNEMKYKEVYEDLAVNMRARITFKDINGNCWLRNEKGKLKKSR
jgi:hypothetical protein